MPLSEDKAWFRSRKFGIGWALHKSWQGWLMLVAYLLLLGLGAGLLKERRAAGFFVYAAMLTAGALWICWWKGEPSRWRAKP